VNEAPVVRLSRKEDKKVEKSGSEVKSNTLSFFCQRLCFVKPVLNLAECHCALKA
jgi:hypothetical protein